MRVALSYLLIAWLVLQIGDGFADLHSELVARVATMRESFRAEPNLSRELLLEAGLAGP